MWTVTGRRSPSRSPRCRPGCAPPLGCGQRSRPRWRTAGTSPRSLLRIGCRGRRCTGRSSCTARSSWSSRSRRRCWGWTRPGSAGRGGCPTGTTTVPARTAGCEVVVIDPHAGYAAAVRAALPHAVIAVDHFHLVMLANKTVTAVRQRVTRDLLDRRGRKTDPTWANRRLLLRGREHLSARALARMWNGCIDHDPTGQILSAWIAKEELRALCATAARGGHRHEIHQRLWAFYAWCADAQIPELTTLAETIETWWPAVLVFLQTGLTNARTEGTNRLIKQVKR